MGDLQGTEINLTCLYRNNNYSSSLVEQDNYELNDEYNLIVGNKIRDGFYSIVYKGTLKRRNDESQVVAVKQLKIQYNGTALSDFQREMNIMKNLNQANIVKIRGVQTVPEICLVMEFAKEGSLKDFLKKHKGYLSQKKLLDISLNIVKGMNYLESKRIVHRDLAARNVLIFNNFSIKISDFRSARISKSEGYYLVETERFLPYKWLALESLMYTFFSFKSDIWSFGVTLFEVFERGKDPNLKLNNEAYEDPVKFVEALKKGVRLPCPENCPDRMYTTIMYPCWEEISNSRPTFFQLQEKITNLLRVYDDSRK